MKNVLQDITQLLLASEDDSKHWSQKIMLSVTDQLIKALPNYTLDWDEGAGEDWATLESKENSIVAISRNKPLVLAAAFNEASAISILQSHNVKIVSSSGWDQDSITFDFSHYQRETPHWLARTEALLKSNGGLMSLHDFWFSTV